MMTTQKQARAAFWEAYPEFDGEARLHGRRSKSQNHQNASCRCAFVGFVDALQKSGQITEALAKRVTL